MFTAVCTAALALGAYACTDSNFAGGAAKGSSLSDGKKDLNDGGSDTGGKDSGGKDSGGKDGGTGNDGGTLGHVDGADGTGTGTGGVDSADSSDGKDKGGIDTTDGQADTTDVGADDGENSAQTHHDGVVTRTLHDDHVSITVEALIKGKVVKTVTVDTGNDKDSGPWPMAGICRNNKNTCLRLTFNNQDGHGDQGPRTLGAGDCTWLISNTGNSATVDTDTNSGCASGPGKDEEFIITCPKSSKLEVQNCLGG